MHGHTSMCPSPFSSFDIFLICWPKRTSSFLSYFYGLIPLTQCAIHTPLCQKQNLRNPLLMKLSMKLSGPTVQLVRVPVLSNLSLRPVDPDHYREPCGDQVTVSGSWMLTTIFVWTLFICISCYSGVPSACTYSFPRNVISTWMKWTITIRSSFSSQKWPYPG